MTLEITSPAFQDQGEILAEFTCDAEDRSPPLAWSGVPEGAKSLALIVDDPDAPDPAAPKVVWVHWVLYDMAATATGLPAAATNADLPDGTRVGLNDWNASRYGGPCPPIGRHRYFFKLYALDTVLGELDPPTKVQLKIAMDGHILDEAQIMGTYERQ